MSEAETIGAQFARALAAKDFGRIGALLHRERVGYRLSVRCPDGDYVVEQQAYLSTREGRIDWMRVLCAGYRPAP